MFQLPCMRRSQAEQLADSLGETLERAKICHTRAELLLHDGDAGGAQDLAAKALETFTGSRTVGLLHGLLQGDDMARALQVGAAWGAATVAQLRSIPVPWEELAGPFH